MGRGRECMATSSGQMDLENRGKPESPGVSTGSLKWCYLLTGRQEDPMEGGRQALGRTEEIID